MMCFKYDLKVGLLQDFYKYFIIAFIVLFACADFYLKTNSIEGIVFSDYILHIFRGMKPYVKGEGEFEIPILWFTINLYLAYIIGKYPKEDLYRCGINVILKSKARNIWWISKIVWSALSVIIYYIVIYFTIIIFCVFAKVDFVLQIHKIETSWLLLFSDKENINLYAMFFLPVFCSISISLFQLTIIFFTDVVYGFISVAVVLISSAYLYTPALVGNISMLERCEYFQYNGISVELSYFICTILAAVSIIIGSKYFKKYDILGKE